MKLISKTAESHQSGLEKVNENGRLRAFTLIELLVVIAIIAILTSLVGTAYRRAMVNARLVSSVNTLRQLSAMTVNYAADHDNTTPREKGTGGDTWITVAQAVNADVWYNALPKMCGMPPASEYASNRAAFYKKGSIFYCPSATLPANSLSNPLFPFVMNSKLNQPSTIRLVSIVDPSRTVLFLEAGLPGEKPVYTTQSAYNGQPYAFASRYVARYDSLGVVGFADGHAESLKGQDVMTTAGKAYFPQKLGKVFWTNDPTIDANL